MCIGNDTMYNSEPDDSNDEIFTRAPKPGHEGSGLAYPAPASGSGKYVRAKSHGAGSSSMGMLSRICKGFFMSADRGCPDRIDGELASVLIRHIRMNNHGLQASSWLEANQKNHDFKFEDLGTLKFVCIRLIILSLPV